MVQARLLQEGEVQAREALTAEQSQEEHPEAARLPTRLAAITTNNMLVGFTGS